jgi:N-acetylglucosamine kinase-like BadF-type ATPase
VSERLAVAIDGGNSKTDVAIVSDEGRVLSVVRGGLSSPHHLGLDGSLQLLDELVAKAWSRAGVNRRPAEVAAVLLAGLDLPVEEERFVGVAGDRGWARRLVATNDTFAVLRAGTDSAYGIAVVCGAGINCVGVGPAGRRARFPALGAITGDWGGGYDLGLGALSAAARSEDGRGRRTRLEQLVPRHFDLATPREVGEAIHFGRLAGGRVVELAPLVLAAAADDGVAASLVERLADEVATLVRTALAQIEPLPPPVEVVLGGGVLQSGSRVLVGAIEERLGRLETPLEVRVAAAPPVAGAALIALDELGAAREAKERVRTELAGERREELVGG